jgi:hypothetical protein
MCQADPWRDSHVWQVSKDWFQPRLNLLREILEEVEKLERGDENPNKALDFRNADGTRPPRVRTRRIENG